MTEITPYVQTLNNYSDIIDSLYEQSIINYEKKQEKRTNIHVSDLVSDCMRKPWYRLRDYQQKEKSFGEALPLVHGTMLHECVNLGGIEHELKLAGNIKTMKPVEYTNKPRKKDRYECIQGSMDDLIEIDDELVICDKKTTKQIPKIVSEQYQQQLNIYKLLYYINYNVEVKTGAIIYIDKTSAWNKHKTITFELLDIQDIREYCLESLGVLKQEGIPDRTESFLCNWCPFYKECAPNVYRKSS